MLRDSYTTYYGAIFQDFLYSLMKMDYLYRKEYACYINNRYLKQRKPKVISNAQKFIRNYDLTVDKHFPRKHQIDYDASKITLRTILKCNDYIQSYIELIIKEIGFQNSMYFEFMLNLNNYNIFNNPTNQVKPSLILRQKDFATSYKIINRKRYYVV